MSVQDFYRLIVYKSTIIIKNKIIITDIDYKKSVEENK
jgi:hypothetical protein